MRELGIENSPCDGIDCCMMISSFLDVYLLQECFTPSMRLNCLGLIKAFRG